MPSVFNTETQNHSCQQCNRFCFCTWNHFCDSDSQLETCILTAHGLPNISHKFCQNWTDSKWWPQNFYLWCDILVYDKYNEFTELVQYCLHLWDKEYSFTIYKVILLIMSIHPASSKVFNVLLNIICVCVSACFL